MSSIASESTHFALVGDPGFLGWLTTFAYLGAAVLCLRAWRACPRGGERSRLAPAWAALALLMFLLGMNKQLDLQTQLTVLGKLAAQQGGWYAQRHIVQVWFIRLLVVSVAGAALVSGWWLRRHLRALLLPVFGVAAVAVYVLLRAAAFHHALSTSGTPLWWLELGGIAAVAVGAWRFSHPPSAR